MQFGSGYCKSYNLIILDIAYFDDPRNNTSALAAKLQSDAGMVQAAAGGQLGIVASCIGKEKKSLNKQTGGWYPRKPLF